MIKVGTSNDGSKINVSHKPAAIQQIKIENVDTSGQLSIIKSSEATTQLKLQQDRSEKQIKIHTEECPADIKIATLCPYKRELGVAIETRVPKSLNLLERVSFEEIEETVGLSDSKIYIDIGDKQGYTTLEDIKKLNTKTIFVDDLRDDKTKNLAEFDMIMLNVKEN